MTYIIPTMLSPTTMPESLAFDMVPKRKGIIMQKKAVAALLVVLLMASGAVSLYSQTDEDAFDASLPTISMTEMKFNGGNFPPGTAPKSVLTLTGAATGELAFNVVNDGTVLHEIRSPLFLATKEVKVLLYTPDNEFIAEFEGTDTLEVELEVGYKATFKIELAGAVAKGYQKDATLSLDYEISCHVPGHYEAGMRALITLKA